MVILEQLPQPFSRAEAIAVGVTARRLSRAVADGRLVRLGSGLYAVRAAWRALAPWVRHRLLSEAAARVTPDAIVSHLSGAVILGLPHPAYEPTKVTMTLLDDSRTSRRDTWRQFHRGSTPAEQVIIRRGLPYLSPARTVIDCCRELHPRDALAIIDNALRTGLVNRDELRRMRRHQHHWPGIATADPLLRLADGRRENWLESVSAWALHVEGPPSGVPQVDVLDPGGRFVGRVDALWAALGVVGEADGTGKYALGAASDSDADRAAAVETNLIAERRRENELGDLGLEVFRWGRADALSGGPVGAKFRAARDRAHPAGVTAQFRCTCCRRPLTYCEFRTPEAA